MDLLDRVGALANLHAVVATATRSAVSADEAPASVSIITREDIERRQALSVEDVLRGLPGVSTANSGGLGKTTDVFVRGTNEDHVLTLVNGVKVGSATLGTVPFENLPVALIERIEGVRGPRSSLYGSEAIEGVIQIFTRRGGGPFTPFLSAGGGSFGTYRVAAGASGEQARGWYDFAVTHLGSRGFNACNGTPVAPGGGCFTLEPDDDGYRNTAGSARVGFGFPGGLEAELHFLRAEGHTQFDGASTNEADLVQQVAGGRLSVAPSPTWSLRLLGGRSTDRQDNFLGGAFVSRFDTDRDTYDVGGPVRQQSGCQGVHLVVGNVDRSGARRGSDLRNTLNPVKKLP